MPVVFTYEPPALDAGLVLHGLIDAAEIAGANALLEASRPGCPVDTGEMRDSGHVEHGPDGAAVIYTRLSPEGYEVAPRQHEDETLDHPKGGHAHWLLDPMHNAHGVILPAMLAELRF